MNRKTVLVTGATSGIGLAGAEELARRGWRVLVHARSQARAQATLLGLRRAVPDGEFEEVLGDLSSLTGVAELARQVQTKTQVLDALWNNAGGIQQERHVTVDGVELQMAVNHLAPFALTRLLLPVIKNAPAGRIVSTSSMAHFFAPNSPSDWLVPTGRYHPMAVYGQSKLANILFTQQLTHRLQGTRVTAHAFHPGFVKTGFGSSGEPHKKGWIEHLSFLALLPAQGADTGVFLVDEPKALANPGKYWAKRVLKKPSSMATPEAATRLWEQSEAVVLRVLGGTW